VKLAINPAVGGGDYFLLDPRLPSQHQNITTSADTNFYSLLSAQAFSALGFQCFDAVDWAAGRASGL